MVEAPGSNILFLLKPIMIELMRVRCMGKVLLVTLAKILTGRQAEGVIGSGGRNPKSKVGYVGSGARVRARYNAHLPTLSLPDGDYLRILLVGPVLPALHGHVIYKNWHLCGVCWNYCERKYLQVPTPSLGLATTIVSLLKVTQGI